MGLVGLQLKDDPENAWNLKQFIWITVRERSGATRAELAWEALKVEAVPWSVWPAEQAEGLQSHLRQLKAFLGGKVEGMDRGFYVLLRGIDSEASIPRHVVARLSLTRRERCTVHRLEQSLFGRRT